MNADQEAELAELNAIPACEYHLQTHLPCPFACQMKGALPPVFNTLFLVFGGPRCFENFFEVVPVALHRNVARGLAFSAEHWQMDPIFGPRRVVELLEDQRNGLVVQLTAAGVLPLAWAAENTFEHQAVIREVPFTPLQPPSRRRRCLFHSRQGARCPVTCIFRPIFSPTCNQELFNIIYERYGGALLIPTFFEGLVLGNLERTQLSESLLLEARTWIDEPGGGLWIVASRLERTIDFLESLL